MGAARGLAGVSRSCCGHVDIPTESSANVQDYLEATRRSAAVSRADVILPITDLASRALLGQSALLGAVVAGSTSEAFARASDKALLISVAASCGLSVPQQVELERESDAIDLDRERLPYPIVVKPARSVVDVDGRTSRQGVHMVTDAVELSVTLSRIPGAAYPLLLQRRTFGEGVGVFLLRSAATTHLAFGHRRIREKPPSGGVSTYREATAPPTQLITRCERLLDALGYEGAAMIEFKHDQESGEFVLMEINGRLWGSLQLAIDAGLDFPSTMIALALGAPVPTGQIGVLGTRTFWELGELDHALAISRSSAAALHLPPTTPTGIRAGLRALMDRRWSDRAEVFRWHDPVPFAAELARWLRRT